MARCTGLSRRLRAGTAQASARFEISNPARESGKSHYGISRTFRVFFDLLTIRFLLKYMTRPLHFFGGLGALAEVCGAGIAIWLLVHKLLSGHDVAGEHAPWFIIAAVLILAGIQLIGVGLLGELQVRHFFTNSQRSPVRRGPRGADEARRAGYVQQGLGRLCARFKFRRRAAQRSSN